MVDEDEGLVFPPGGVQPGGGDDLGGGGAASVDGKRGLAGEGEEAFLGKDEVGFFAAVLLNGGFFEHGEIDRVSSGEGQGESEDPAEHDGWKGRV